MNQTEFKKQWQLAFAAAQIHGWDFSPIENRYQQDPPPWDYRQEVLSVLAPESRILDMDPGGGEFLLSLGHPPQLTAVTEGYPPNVELCQRELAPLGIQVEAVSPGGPLPFASQQFDLVLNRHGAFDSREVYRVLKPGGRFLTQQVGEQNDRELISLLLPHAQPGFPGWNLTNAAASLTAQGFVLERQEEAFPAICFYDTPALVWFAAILPWEFPGFSPENCLNQLTEAQTILEREGALSGRAHRFFLMAKKPKDSPCFRQATNSDLNALLTLYRDCAAHASTHGNFGWDENYPNREFAQFDLDHQGLFVLEYQGQLAAAVTLLPTDDLDELDCWTPARSCALTRLCVSPQLQGRHLAQQLLDSVLEEARRRGYTATRHLSLASNLASNRLYQRMGFVQKGQAHLYEQDFLCMERLL